MAAEMGTMTDGTPMAWADAGATPPLVSVIIPAFNAEATIDAAIASARAQAERRIEILVIDDASTDATAEAVIRQASEDHRVRLIRMATNGGPAAARNRGLAEVRGAWIALLDADDAYAPERLSTLLRLAEEQAADMVADNVVLHHPGSSVADAPMIPHALLPRASRLSTAEFIARNVGTPDLPRVSYGFLKPMIRAAFLRAHAIRYDERNRFAEDYMLYVRCLTHGAVWWLTPAATYRYTIRQNSLTEVQTSADLKRISLMDQALIDDPGSAATADLIVALRRHKAVIDRCYHYRAFTDALKARSFPAAARLFFENRTSVRSIVLEGARQVPTIVGKALRGGYRRA